MTNRAPTAIVALLSTWALSCVGTFGGPPIAPERALIVHVETEHSRTGYWAKNGVRIGRADECDERLRQAIAGVAAAERILQTCQWHDAAITNFGLATAAFGAAFAGELVLDPNRTRAGYVSLGAFAGGTAMFIGMFIAAVRHLGEPGDVVHAYNDAISAP